MNKLGYFLLASFVYLFSLIPFRILYWISDGVYLLLYYVIKYRREVVKKNLRNSFPNKSDEELLDIEKKFYHSLCDVVLETVKLFTISKQTMLHRCSFTNEAKQLFNSIASENKSIVVAMGHLCNWEYCNITSSLELDYPLLAIYHPIKNKAVNKLMLKMRTRYNTIFVPMQDTIRELVKHRNEVHFTAFIADQTPLPASAYWLRFLHQETPVLKGTEKIAQKFNYPVVFLSMHRIKRGYYSISAELLFTESAKTQEGEILKSFFKCLEREIVNHPEIWLWSHKRWKHKPPMHQNV